MTTDASEFAIKGILSEGKIGKDKHISYTSRSLNDCERKYDTYEKEALAIIYCVTHFCPYLYGQKFILVTEMEYTCLILNVKKKYQKKILHAIKKWIMILFKKLLKRIILRKLEVL